MAPKTHAPDSADSRTEKEKELRRVYRKLKGVRSELSVKMRKLRMESSLADFPTSDSILSDNEIEAERDNESSDDESARANNRTVGRSAIDSAQYEVKSLIDQKNRLRKRFWKLQEEVQKKK